MDDLDYRRAADARHAENRARFAQVNARFAQTGFGSMEFADPVDFGLTFIDEPYVSTGHSIDVDELGVDDSDETPTLPQITSYVVEWSRDDRGFYVGAWCAGTVTYAPTSSDPADTAEIEGAREQATVKHMFTFSATAIKDIPIDVTN